MNTINSRKVLDIAIRWVKVGSSPQLRHPLLYKNTCYTTRRVISYRLLLHTIFIQSSMCVRELISVPGSSRLSVIPAVGVTCTHMHVPTYRSTDHVIKKNTEIFKDSYLMSLSVVFMTLFIASHFFSLCCCRTFMNKFWPR